MPSIEILVEHPQLKSAERVPEYAFAIKTTCPPLSHRNPSIWQTFFTHTGGLLFHIGEPRFKETSAGWFFAYDLLDIEKESCFFKLKQEYRHHMSCFLEYALNQSQNGKAHFTSDWQLSENLPFTYKELSLNDFWTKHDQQGIRFNARIPLTIC
jgi:hypothetical protein